MCMTEPATLAQNMIFSTKSQLRTGTTPDRHGFFGIRKHAQDRIDVTNPLEHSELMTHMLDFLEIREILEFSKNSQEAFQKDSHHAKILFATSDRTIGLKRACEIIHPERISAKSMIFRILI